MIPDVKVDVVILIPYMVIQELDKIKHRSERSVSIMAGRAIRFINDALKSKNPKIQGKNRWIPLETAMNHSRN